MGIGVAVGEGVHQWREAAEGAERCAPTEEGYGGCVKDMCEEGQNLERESHRDCGFVSIRRIVLWLNNDVELL